MQRTDTDIAYGKSIKLRPIGDLDQVTAPELLSSFAWLSERARAVIVYLDSVTTADSAGIAALIVLYKRITAVGGRMYLRAVPRWLLELFVLFDPGPDDRIPAAVFVDRRRAEQPSCRRRRRRTRPGTREREAITAVDS